MRRKCTVGENIVSIGIAAAISITVGYGALEAQAPEILPTGYVRLNVDYHWEEIPLDMEKVTVKMDKLIGSAPPVIPVVVESKRAQIKQEKQLGDIELVAQLIECEARGQSYEGKLAVGCTVWNRVDNGKFPNTVYGVIFQTGAYACTENERFAKAGWSVSKKSYQAAMESYEQRPDSEVLYFRTDHYHSFGTPLYQIGDHYFSK